MKLSQSQISSIDESIQLGKGKRVVRLDYSGEKRLSENEHNFNAFCVDDSNNIIWNIASSQPSQRDSFVSIEMDKYGVLKADRFFGEEFEVYIQPGETRKIRWHK